MKLNFTWVKTWQIMPFELDFDDVVWFLSRRQKEEMSINRGLSMIMDVEDYGIAKFWTK